MGIDNPNLAQLGNGVTQSGSALSLRESCSLYEVFGSLIEQLIAYSNQPRFDDGGLAVLEDMSESLARQMRDLVEHIKTTAPMDRIERELKAKTLIRDAMLDTDDISEIAAVATAIAAEAQR